MDLNLTADLYENISEIYEIGSQSVEVITMDRRYVRITAQKVLRGPNTIYVAHYSQLADIEVANQTIQVWKEAAYPWAHGDSIEACIRYGMGFVSSHRV